MAELKLPQDDVLPDLVELCRLHDIGMELIDRSDDVDALLGRVLEEYETRLADLRPDTLDGGPLDADEARKMRSLLMFATQAAALKQKAVASAERNRLERLDGVMKTLAVLSHKINNPLTALLGRAQMLQLRESTDPYGKNACDVIEQSARRIAGYIKELAEVVREGREETLERFLEDTRPEA